MLAYEFGPMRLEADQHALFFRGKALSLPPRLFTILLVLVENEGRLVSQEALRNRVWPDSFVQEAAVSKNVSNLRAALRECMPDMDAIGTVPKRGYQFLLPITVVTSPPAADNAPEPVALAPAVSPASPETAPATSSGRVPWRAGALALTVLLIATALAATYRHRQPWFLAGALSPAALTPGSDVEAMPAISPDGKLLAYTTRRPKSPHYQIYVRALGDHGSFGKPLDTGSGEAFYPAWSPDGRTFAFLRCGTGPCEISTISVEGGAVHVVRSLPRFSLLDDRAYSCYMRMNPVWSPDGKSIIFPYRDIEGDSQRLVKHDLATDTEEVLTSGRQWDEDHSPSLSPDGKSVAFFRMNLTYADVMTVELGTHRQTTVAAHQPLPNNGLTWSPGRLGLVASLQEPGKPWALRWFPFSGTSREMPVALESPQEPTFSPDGKTLMALSVDSSHSLAWVDANRPTETHDLFGSHQIDLTVAFAPNGHGVALLSDRSGNTEIWLADVTAAGASNLRQLTHGLTQNTNFIAWSPSGKQLVLGNSKQRGTLWLVDANTGEIKLLRVPQLEKLLILSPVWAADEQSLYVAVSGDHSGIFRISLGEGLATEELVEDHVWLLQLDGDRALYYTRRSGTGVFRIDLKAPKPVSEPIPVFQKIRASLAWTLSDRALYFVDLYDVEQRLQRYDLLTKTVFDTRTQLSNVRFTGTLSRSAASQISIFSRWNSSSGSRLVTLRPQP